MRVLLQRVKQAKVEVLGKVCGSIEHGMLLLVGISTTDAVRDVELMADKLVHLRIFEDEQGKMNRSLLDHQGAILSVSQFTLYGECRKGRRPNFMAAARPELAASLYEILNTRLRAHGVVVETGLFGAMMDVSLINDGPVTLMLETESGAFV